MSDGMYVGMSGAAARAEQLDAISDNLANAQTVGFTASHPAFESLLPPGNALELTSVGAVAHGVDLQPGLAVTTGRSTDLFPEGGAFLSVRLGDGSVGYTRDGRLAASPSGELRIGENLVLGVDGQAVTVPRGAPFSIDSSGVVSAEGQPVGRLALSKLEGPHERRGAAVLVAGEGGRATAIEGRVRAGELAQSNASALEAAVQLVSVQRHYDTSMQAISTYRKLDERANELGRTR